MSQLTVIGGNGVRLVADTYGDRGAPAVLLLHGGGQTRHSWRNTARDLADAGFFAVSADHRGHGDSGWDPDGSYDWPLFRVDVEAWCNELDTPAVVGASLGGMAALTTAGSRILEGLHPGMRAIVLVDIAPQVEMEGSDKILGFMSARPDGFATLEEAADVIAEYLPHRPRPKDTSGLAKNLRLHEDGRFRWHWDPAWIVDVESRRSARNEGRLEEYARALNFPALLVRGRQSDLLSEDGARNFLELVPHAEYVDVAGAGHMVAGDKNDAFTVGVAEFLTRRYAQA